MRFPNALAASTLSLCLLSPYLPAEEPIPLTPSQIEAMRKMVEDLREGWSGKQLSLNGSAEQAFRNGGSSPKAAVELYLKCEKELNFDRLRKSESDWREWRDANEDRIEFEPFATSLQFQLQYLSLASRAATLKDISPIFADLTAFMKRIESLKSPPHPVLNNSIAETNFAVVFDLDEGLSKREEQWEMNPLNVGGVYEKTIFPFLRLEAPEKLPAAWDSRMLQQGSLARLFFSFEEEMERLLQREEDGSNRRQFQEIARFVKNRAKNAAVFESEQLPLLQWGKLQDQFQYQNQAIAAKGMIDHVQKYLSHPNAGDWISQLETMVNMPSSEP
ncbi:MAG: hypothetical protein AAF191_11895 [Verrucomicrobiota bacterium]